MISISIDWTGNRKPTVRATRTRDAFDPSEPRDSSGKWTGQRQKPHIAASRSEQEALLKARWAEQGNDLDYEDVWSRPGPDLWIKEILAWNAANPAKRIDPNPNANYRFGTQPEFEKHFDDKYLAGKKKPFPGVKQANEWFEENGESFNQPMAVYLSKREIPGYYNERPTGDAKPCPCGCGTVGKNAMFSDLVALKRAQPTRDGFDPSEPRDQKGAATGGQWTASANAGKKPIPTKIGKIMGSVAHKAMGSPKKESNAGKEGQPLASSGNGRGEPGGTGSLEEAQRAAKIAAGSAKEVSGLPKGPFIGEDGKYYVPGPIGALHDAAEKYTKAAGIDYHPVTTYVQIDKERAARIAQVYDAAPDNPDDPKIKAAYSALIKETLGQFKALQDAGYKFEFIKPGMEDPYARTPRLATQDLRDHKHLWVFPTDLGFGSSNNDPNVAKNPMLAPTGIKINGRDTLANDIFRIVHDIYGHFKDGYGFRASGEENAWRSHSRMYSDAARPAMTSETRGQNSWLNYGPHGETNRKASAADTIYAPQKTTIMPDWAVKEGASDPPLTLTKDHMLFLSRMNSR